MYSERMSLRRIGALLAAVGGALALMLGGVVPAQASEPTSAISEMVFVPWTTENLSEYGYELRVAEDGTSYGVPLGTPVGSLEGATGPISGSSGPAARGTVYGNCGSSWVSFSSRSLFRTGYTIAASSGAPISHVWTVTLSSPIDLDYQTLNGIAPIGYQSWSASRTHGAQALKGQTLTALASGYTIHTGGVCISGNPTATIVW